MPRGNDVNALAELSAEYGNGAGNAEALIEANRLRYSESLQSAQMLGVDEEATKNLDMAGVAKAAGLKEDQVLSAACRGKYVVYVAEDETGRAYKDVLLNEGGKLSETDDEETPERANIRAAAEAQKTIREAQEKANEIIEKAKAQAAKTLGKGAEDAQKATEKS